MVSLRNGSAQAPVAHTRPRLTRVRLTQLAPGWSGLLCISEFGAHGPSTLPRIQGLRGSVLFTWRWLTKMGFFSLLLLLFKYFQLVYN